MSREGFTRTLGAFNEAFLYLNILLICCILILLKVIICIDTLYFAYFRFYFNLSNCLRDISCTSDYLRSTPAGQLQEFSSTGFAKNKKLLQRAGSLPHIRLWIYRTGKKNSARKFHFHFSDRLEYNEARGYISIMLIDAANILLRSRMRFSSEARTNESRWGCHRGKAFYLSTIVSGARWTRLHLFSCAHNFQLSSTDVTLMIWAGDRPSSALLISIVRICRRSIHNRVKRKLFMMSH